MSTYNGWTNYETWRVNLEIFDGMSAEDLGCFTRYEEPDPSDVARYLEDYVADILSADCEEGLALSYARAFVSSANYYEIAEHMLSEVEREEERAE